MLVAIAIVAVVLVAVVLIRAARQPDVFEVKRSARIAATPEQIFQQLHDFRNWRAWSPYERLDPEMHRHLGGATKGVGAAYAWSSDGRAGVGRMQIIDAIPDRRLRLTLDFEKPFKASNIVDFTLVPADGHTTVTWAMHGPSSFRGKILQSLMNMDRLVGKDFESGLANLATVVTARPHAEVAAAR